MRLEDALRDVERECAEQLDAYHACVDAKPNDWLQECHAAKSALNSCAASQSTLVANVKARCKSHIEQYERCLQANPTATQTCAPALESLMRCTDELT